MRALIHSLEIFIQNVYPFKIIKIQILLTKIHTFLKYSVYPFQIAFILKHLKLSKNTNSAMMKQGPNINRLDDYVSAFYEDNIENKLKASKEVLAIFQDFNNLEALIEHQSLLQVLSRTLAQNHKRNIDLSVNLLCVFYILSNYRQFQEYVTQQQIGKTVIDVLQNQIQRFDLLYSEYIEMWRKNDEKDKITAKTQLKKLNILIWKQDKLFFISLNILLNISENPNIEKKMRKLGIIQILCRCLQRNDFHLLIVTLVFLRKLSIISQYKNQMIEINVIQKLERFFTCENQILLNFALLVYYNLAFDKLGREVIERCSLIPKFVNLLAQDSPNRMTALNILYLLSTDPGIRYTLAYTNCMDYVLKLILFPHPNVGGVELLALAINLSANERNVEHLTEEDFYKILDKAIKSEDATMLKFCKNILKSLKPQHEIHIGMKEIIKDRLIKMIMTNWKKEETCLEILGIMANSKLGKEWTDILLAHDEFINNIEKKMVDGITPDDILMAIVTVISNICQEAECASYIEQLFEAILSLFLGKEYDSEFIAQLLHAIYSFIFHGVGLQRILSEGEVLVKLIELINDPNEGVREINDEVLTVLRETDDIELAQNIKQSKFYRHNKKWLTETEGVNDWVFNQENYYDGYNNQMLDPRMWQSDEDYD